MKNRRSESVFRVNKFMSFEKPEKFSEQPKTCLIKKLDILYNYFSSEKSLVYDEVLLNNMEKLIAKIEKTEPMWIGDGNHMGHILGQIESGFISAKRLRADHEKKEDKFNLGETKKHREMLKDAKKSMRDYIDLCLQSDTYFRQEIFDKSGYWGDKTTLDKEGKEMEIASANANDFVKISKEHFEDKKSEDYHLKEAA